MSSDSNVKQAGVQEEDEEEEMRCGYLCWTPNWLQRFNNPRFLLVCVCWSTFIQGLVITGFNYVNLSSLERRFDLSSSSAAWIPSSYDVSAGICAVIFGYLAMFVHMGHLIGICALFMSCGSFIMFLPHVLGGIYQLGAKPADICELSGNNTDFCNTYEERSNSYLPLFIVGNMMHGVGGAAIYTVCVPYMDSNIKSKDTALYIGIMQCFASLGPAMGYMFGGLILSIYVDYWRVDMEDINITSSDPRWVGAWWIGYLFSVFASLTVALFFFCFPKELSTAKKNRAHRQSEAYKGVGMEETEIEDFGKSYKDILYSLKTLFTNPTYVFMTISAILESLGVVAFSVFLPKVLQFQFGQTLVMAAVWAGIVVITGAAGGQLIGGVVPKLLNLKLRGLITQCLICLFCGFLLVFQFLLRCDMAKIAGLSVPYFNSSIELDDIDDVFHPCNYDCNCTTITYDPICGQDDVQYFTPCHAGCQDVREIDEKQVFSNCSCIGEPTDDWMLPAEAQAGICTENCDVLGPFLFLFFLINFVTFMTSVAGQAAMMRCVPDRERSFAFGVQASLVRFLGNVPGPILLGQVFDDSCWLWQDTCGTKGACWIYDSAGLATGITYLGVILKGISTVSMFLALVLYRPPPSEVEKDIAINDKEDIMAHDSSVGNGQVIIDAKSGEKNYAFSSEINCITEL